MEIIRIPRIMHDTCRTARLRGKSIGLVPTMGALHGGHMALVRACRMENDLSVASIFVNPSQFGPGEDFESYPRDSEADIAVLREARADALFMPDAEHMYPPGFATRVDVEGLSGKLCGRFRPGHFGAVATVVAKLLNITAPTRAYFGLKDYQQTLIVQRLVEDLNLPVEIVACPTVREQDGLAMSSRNLNLKPDQREAAALIYRTLSKAAGTLSSGSSPKEASGLMAADLGAEPLVTEVQYAGVYDPSTLDPLDAPADSMLLAVAVKLGGVRLIDNIVVKLHQTEHAGRRRCD